MHVVELVLANINNGQHLAIQMEDNAPLLKLVEGYNNFALSAQGSSLYAATGDTYGFDLKRFVSQLPAEPKMRLLNEYLQDCESKDISVEESEDSDVQQPPPTPTHHPKRRETDAQRDDRKLKHFMIKSAVIAGLILIILTVGAGFGIMYHSKTLPNSALINTILDTAMSVIKVLFGLAKN